ncbi:hypothetical protein FNV43_RR03911 [Rhamnella rubrinervis]|uniref:Uncharacterized protein n=1 Tax=Rhamnella rubrinervis TaxID=2594499 RepID=A0A8K0MP37_9ROSA|nr:hypothetical protein FNV43_RR03911 [Rhamnella rubrinervis]
MADYAAPSFSLGLDLGLDSEPEIAVEESSSSKTAPAPATDPLLNLPTSPGNEDEELELLVEDSDNETGPEPPRILKRLRRGPTHFRETPTSLCNGDDDIEDFSSQEDGVKELHPSTWYQSMCSSSKVPLHGCGVITTQSSNQWKERKKKTVSGISASASMEKSQNEKMFPRLTISPLRRFQLIDSDSDDPSACEDVSRMPHKIDLSSKKQQLNPGPSVSPSDKMRKAPDGMPQNVDLWKDFSPVKSFHIPTPALDEVCEEYFGSVKDKNVAENSGSKVCSQRNWVSDETANGQNIEKSLNFAGPLPPAHYYFFHKDARIRKLVRDRLPHFFPLGAIDNGGNQHYGASVIDYMGQFSNEEPSKRQTTQQTDLQRSSKRGRGDILQASESWMDAEKCDTAQNSRVKKRTKNGKNKSDKSNAGEVLHASESWVEPEQGKATRTSRVKKSSKQRNVSKRVNAGEVLHGSGSWVDPRSSQSAGRQSAGHWYTAPDGRKVYVNKSGQELTGQIAYRHYRKDNGARFRKGKAKTNPKKKKG